MKRLIAAIAVALLAGQAGAADPVMTPVTDLSDATPNTWVRITDHQTGQRAGSAIFYSVPSKRFVVAQGLDYNKKVIEPYDVQTFDLAKGQWVNHYPPGKEGEWGPPVGKATDASFPHSVNYWGFKDREGVLRPPGRKELTNGYAVEPDGAGFYTYIRGGRLIGIQPGCVWRYDVAERTWTQIVESHEIDVPAFAPPVDLTGASLVYEPTNKELLLLGGQASNVAGANVGNWALSLEDKTWSRLPAPETDAEWKQRQRRLADAAGRARNLYYLDIPADEKAERLNKEVQPDVAAVLGELQQHVAAMGTKISAPHGTAIVQRVSQAVALLEPRAKELADGKLTGDLVADVTLAARELEAVIRLAAPVPVPRAEASVCYDPVNKVVVLFGGDRFDGVLNDTWIYDPAKRTWEQKFPKIAPPPRAKGVLVYLPKAKKLALIGGVTINHKFIYYSGIYQDLPADVWLYDVASNTWELAVEPTGDIGFNQPNQSPLSAAGPDDTIISLSNPHGWPHRADGGTWAVKIDATKIDAEATAKLGQPPSTMTSRAITYDKGAENFVYDPAWYDRAEPGDPAAVADWLAKLPDNTWVQVPGAPRHVPQSEWGTAVYDHFRDRIYYWTGGHMADPSNAIHTYYPGLNRWSIPWVAEIPLSKGRTFHDRPDCKNHTYHNYTLDPITRKVVAATYGGTGIYDPETGRWEMMTEMPFKQSHYTMNLFETPKGVLVWAEGFFGMFDAAAKEYKPQKADGGMPGYLGADRSGACWDSKRNVMWMFTAKSFSEASGQVWKLDMDKWQVQAMDPANMDTIGKSSLYARENTYLPKVDLVLTKAFAGRGESGRQLAYDPAENRWVLTNIRPLGRITGPVAMVYDSKRDLVWCMAGGRTTYVLRINPKTLTLSDTPEPPAPKKE